MKLKNSVIRNGILALIQAAELDVVDGRTTYNMGRTLKYLNMAWDKVEEERKILFKNIFGDIKAADRNHPKKPEYDEQYEELLKEETEVEKVFKVTSENLMNVKEGSKAVPGTIWNALEFMIEDEEPEVKKPEGKKQNAKVA